MLTRLLNPELLVADSSRSCLLEVNLEQSIAEARLDRVLIHIVGKTEATRDLAERALTATSDPVRHLRVMGALLVRVDAEEVSIDLDAELLLADSR